MRLCGPEGKAVTSVASSHRDPGAPRPAPRSRRSAPAPARPPPNTASPGSSAPAPSPARRHGRTSAPGWWQHLAAASCSRPPPASGGHQRPAAAAAQKAAAAATQCRSGCDSPRRTRRHGRAGARAPMTAPPGLYRPSAHSTASHRSNSASARAVKHLYSSPRKTASRSSAPPPAARSSTGPSTHAILNATAAAVAFEILVGTRRSSCGGRLLSGATPGKITDLGEAGQPRLNAKLRVPGNRCRLRRLVFGRVSQR